MFLHLRDSQDLRFTLSPPAARPALAPGGGTDTVDAVIARLHPGADPDAVAETIRRWKYLAALTDGGETALLTRSVVNRARSVMDLLRRMAAERQAAVLVVTDDEKTFDRFDRMVGLRDGRIDAAA